MRAGEIDRMRRISLNKNLTHWVVEVEIINTAYRGGSLKFKIDDREVQNWLRKLVLKGDEFKMLNTQTGAMLWSKNLQGDLKKLAQTMVSK
jgi:hypothetical protein